MQNASLSRFLSTASKNLSRVSDQWLEVLRLNARFSPVFKPLNFNIASYSSGKSGFVFVSFQ